MQKRILAALLCAILIMALLPAAALAEEGSGALDLSGASATDIKTYAAGGGTVTWDPTTSPAKLTFHNAKITVDTSSTLSDATAVTLPSWNDGIDVVFSGDNSITAKSARTATAFTCASDITIKLLPDSNTTLTAAGGMTSYGIRFHTDKPNTLEITGSGKLKVSATCSETSAFAYAIDAYGSISCPVSLTGGTLDFTGFVGGKNVTLGNITVPSNGMLDLNHPGAVNVIKGESGAIIDGTLRLKDGTTIDAINTLGLTGSGIVQVGDSGFFFYVGGEWVVYGADVSNSGLNLTDLPSVKTAYKAGTGTIVFTPAAEGGNPTLTLNNATNEVSIWLKHGAYTLALNGKNTTGNISVENVDSDNSLTVTVADDASLTAPLLSANSVTVTGNKAKLNANTGTIDGLTFYGSQSFINGATQPSFVVDEDATITVNGDNVVFQSETPTCTFTNNGKIIINSAKKLDLSKCTTIAGTGSSIENNGVLILPAGTNGDQIRAMNLTGDGVVEAGSETYTNDGAKLHKYKSLNFETKLYWIEGREDPYGFPSSTDVAADGFKFEGDSTNGYKITLGNLLIEPQGDAAITLPSNGNVTVYLENATTTRIAGRGDGIRCGDTHTVTINGTGNLEILVTSDQGAINAGGKLIIEGGNITVKNDSGGGIVISGYEGSSEKTVNITGGKLSITGKDSAIQAPNIIIGSGMRITYPKNAKIGPSVDIGYTILVDKSAAASVTIEPAPAPSGADSDYPPSSVTVYNDPVQPDATVWLTGSGLNSSDLLITERDPQGSAYEALLKLADSDDVLATYNISLESGKKSTGYAMHLTFDLNAKYAGDAFTLVHQKADSTYEYFYDTADANGDFTFGPLYELSPFMLVKGRLTKTSALAIPKTGDSTQTVLWLGLALTAAALAGITLRKQKRD